MAETGFDLGKLIAPVDPALFFAEYWEKQPLVVARSDPGYYGGLLSTADVDAVIAFTRPKFADPADFAPDPPRAKSFVQGWLADRPAQEGPVFPGVEDLQRVYAAGKTVVIMTMQQRWLPVAALCRNLEAVFFCPVHANMYLTPEGAQGFDAHYDTHEVLVLQLEGSKHWRLYGEGRRLPTVGERLNAPRDQLGTPREVHLEAGDLLYLPRGVVHEAFTSECHSLHLTVGINIYRWSDLLHEALDELIRRDERFRESLPPGVLAGNDPPEGVKARFAELLGALAASARPGDAVRRLGDQFFGHLPVLPGTRFGPPDDGEGVDLDTPLEKSPGTVCRVVQEGGWVEVQFPGGRVGGPAKIAAALRFVAGAGRFAARDLPEGLGAEAKLVLVRRLLRERLIRVVRPASGGAGAEN